MDAPLILDVDTGVDDAIAIALAVAKGANLIGVTTVAGNVPVEVATRNSLDVLAWLERSDIPVHRGASRPLVASYHDATHVHGGNGLGDWMPPPSSASEGVLAGPAFILQSAARHAGSLVLAMVGPLTNLAIAMNVRPEIVDQIDHLVVMGGAYHVPGNITPDAEFNIYVDPHAADQVLAAPWKQISLVGLDVSHKTAFPQSAWRNIPTGAEGATGLIRNVMARTFTERKMSGFYLHDPLALAVALDPSLVTFERAAVSVETAGDARGKTILGETGAGPSIAIAVDAARFLDDFGQVFGLAGVGDLASLDHAE